MKFAMEFNFENENNDSQPSSSCETFIRNENPLGWNDSDILPYTSKELLLKNKFEKMLRKILQVLSVCKVSGSAVIEVAIHFLKRWVHKYALDHELGMSHKCYLIGFAGKYLLEELYLHKIRSLVDDRPNMFEKGPAVKYISQNIKNGTLVLAIVFNDAQGLKEFQEIWKNTSSRRKRKQTDDQKFLQQDSIEPLEKRYKISTLKDTQKEDGNSKLGPTQNKMEKPSGTPCDFDIVDITSDAEESVQSSPARNGGAGISTEGKADISPSLVVAVDSATLPNAKMPECCKNDENQETSVSEAVLSKSLEIVQDFMAVTIPKFAKRSKGRNNKVD